MARNATVRSGFQTYIVDGVVPPRVGWRPRTGPAAATTVLRRACIDCAKRSNADDPLVILLMPRPRTPPFTHRGLLRNPRWGGGTSLGGLRRIAYCDSP